MTAGSLEGGPAAPRYDSLDMWRGAACLLVLVNHAVTYQLPPGRLPDGVEQWYVAAAAVAARLWAGVPIFFVISGYCISATADNQRRRGTPVSTYFVRRFRRIFPPYWIVLFGTAALIAVSDVALGGRMSASGLLRPWWYSPAQWLGSVTLTETWRFHLFGGQKALVLGHAWTLCYEEQFYAVCGLLLLLCPRRFFAGAAAVTGAVVVVALAAAYLGREGQIDGFFFDGRWVQFALGILLYYVLNYAGAGDFWLAVTTFAGVVAAAAAQGPALLDPTKNVAQEFLIAGLFGLAALALRPLDGRLMTTAALKPLRLCGAMCYSLYLVHLPVTNLLRASLAASGVDVNTLPPFVSLPVYGLPSIVIAWWFHVLIERRFMNRGTVPVRAQRLAVPAVL